MTAPVQLPNLRVGADGEVELYRWLNTIAEWLRAWRSGTFTWDPPNVPAATAVSTSVTVADIAADMTVTVNPPGDLGGLSVVVRAAEDAIVIELVNATAGPINLASGTWRYMAIPGGL